MADICSAEALEWLNRLTARGYTPGGAVLVALELLEQIERIPRGSCLALCRTDDDTAGATLLPLPLALNASGQRLTEADDFATAAGAELVKRAPHFVITGEGLAFSPGKKG